MSIDKMDSSAVYGLFEELKRKIAELGSRIVQGAQNSSNIDSNEIVRLLNELQILASQKEFTPEQVKVLQDNLGKFAAGALVKSNEKIEKVFAEVANLFNQIEERIKALNIPMDFVIRKEYSFSIDFKSSKAAIAMIIMGLAILISVTINIYQSRRNSMLSDNDLKYRYIKMLGKANQENLLRLETTFTYKRNNDSITIIRKNVESYERLVKEQAERIERARLSASEAERLQKEAELIKGR